MKQYLPPKPVKVINTKSDEVSYFKSMKQCMDHYSIQYPQIIKWLKRGTPVQYGPREGLIFYYATDRELMDADFEYRQFIKHPKFELHGNGDMSLYRGINND